MFRTRDDADILISIQSDREWRVLAKEVLGDPALAADPNFATNVERVKRRAETDRKVAAVFAALDVAPLIDRLAAADIAFGRVNDTGTLGAASAPAPHHDRHAERAGRLPGAGRAERIVDAPLRPGAGAGRTHREGAGGVHAAPQRNELGLALRLSGGNYCDTAELTWARDGNHKGGGHVACPR